VKKVRVFIFQVLFLLLLIAPQSSQALGGDIDIIESLNRGINAFPIKTEFMVGKGELAVNQMVIKDLGDRKLRIKLLKIENGMEYYRSEIWGDSFNFYITVDENSRQIQSFMYDIVPSDMFKTSFYNDIYNPCLAIVESYYGMPTKQGSEFYQANNLSFAAFYEKDKYQYHLGLYKDPKKSGPSLRFAVSVCAPGGDPEGAKAAQEGYTFFVNKQYDKALEKFNVASQLDPDNLLAAHGKISAYIAKNMLDKAIAEANSIIAKRPDVATSYCLRANAYLQKGNEAEAQKDYLLYQKYAKPNDPLEQSVKDILRRLK